MKRLTEVEIRDRDKRLAARREAAHVVVAAVYDGMLLGAQIMESGTYDIHAYLTWVGQTHRTDGGIEGQSALLKWRSSEDAAAGLAAECCWTTPMLRTGLCRLRRPRCVLDASNRQSTASR